MNYNNRGQKWNEGKIKFRRKLKSYRMVTSFTDRQVSGWVMEDAIREIWQNFCNGLKKRFNGELKYKWVPEDTSLPIEKVVAFVGISKDGKISIKFDEIKITQKYRFLEPDHLQLTTTKEIGEISSQPTVYQIIWQCV